MRTQSKLNPYTLHIVVDVDHNSWSNVLTHNDKIFIYESLETFNKLFIDKFIKGKQEHGGEITDRPLLPELEKELIDAWAYVQGVKARAEMYKELVAKELGEVKGINELKDPEL